MPMIVIAAATALAGALAAIGWLTLAPRDRTRELVMANATTGLAGTNVAVDGRTPMTAAAATLRQFSPPRWLQWLDQQLALAGRPPAWTIDRILLAKLGLTATAGVAGFLFVHAAPSALRVLITASVTILLFFLPDLLLLSKGQERQTRIGLELPDTLDQMTIAVEAGLGFESAMLRTARNGTGPLAEELTRTLQDMQLGQSRKDAYLALSERSTVADLRRFLRAVIQADMYGIAIADVLRTQAAEMRLKRRQRAEEKAMKIPVKVIFPLLLCILPALFLIIMGPAALDITKTFSDI